NARQHGHFAAALQGKVSAAGRPGARYDRILVSARAGRPSGLPGFPKRLSDRPGSLFEPGGLLSDRRESIESGGGPRDDPMKHTCLTAAALSAGACLLLAGCNAQGKGDPKAEAPPPAQVEQGQNAGLLKGDDPSKFPLATAGEHDAAPELKVTGVVGADVSRNIPVITLASGRVTEIHARLGDTVTAGQLLMKVQSADISGAYSDYEQARADETLARSQFDRAKILYDK